MNNFETFYNKYYENLKAAIAENPRLFRWVPPEGESLTQQIDRVAIIEAFAYRMVDGFRNGSSSKDSPTVKQTCKDLNIKHTYTAIKAFLLS